MRPFVLACKQKGHNSQADLHLLPTPCRQALSACGFSVLEPSTGSRQCWPEIVQKQPAFAPYDLRNLLLDEMSSKTLSGEDCRYHFQNHACSQPPQSQMLQRHLMKQIIYASVCDFCVHLRRMLMQ